MNEVNEYKRKVKTTAKKLPTSTFTHVKREPEPIEALSDASDEKKSKSKIIIDLTLDDDTDKVQYDISSDAFIQEIAEKTKLAAEEDEALNWLVWAADELESPLAQYNLGVICVDEYLDYLNDKTNFRKKRAFKAAEGRLQQALENGHLPAQTKLNELYQHRANHKLQEKIAHHESSEEYEKPEDDPPLQGSLKKRKIKIVLTQKAEVPAPSMEPTTTSTVEPTNAEPVRVESSSEDSEMSLKKSIANRSIKAWAKLVQLYLSDVNQEEKYVEGLRMLTTCIQHLGFADAFDPDEATMNEIKKLAPGLFIKSSIMLAEKRLSISKLAIFESGFELLKKLENENPLDGSDKTKVTNLQAKAAFTLAKHHLKTDNREQGIYLLGFAADKGNLNAIWEIFDILTAKGNNAYEHAQSLLVIGLRQLGLRQADTLFDKALPRLLALAKHLLSTASLPEHYLNAIACIQTADELAKKSTQASSTFFASSILLKMQIPGDLANAQLELGKKYMSDKDKNFAQDLDKAISYIEASYKIKQLPKTETALGEALFMLGKQLLKKVPLTLELQQTAIEHLQRAIEIKERTDQKKWPEGRTFLCEKSYLLAKAYLKDKNPASARSIEKYLLISIRALPTSYNSYQLGILYSDATYGKKDLQKAQSCFQAAQKSGHKDAQKRLDEMASAVPKNPYLPH